MPSLVAARRLLSASLGLLLVSAGCNSILGFDDYALAVPCGLAGYRATCPCPDNVPGVGVCQGQGSSELQMTSCFCAASGSSSAPSCGPDWLKLGAPRCDACAAASCCKEANDCGTSDSCKSVVGCYRGCALSDAGCFELCRGKDKQGAIYLEAWGKCLSSSCPTACGS